MEALLADQTAEAESLGLSSRKVEKLLHQTQPTPLEQVCGNALKESLQEITVQQAHFSAREIELRVCEKAQYLGVSGDQVVQGVLRGLDQCEDIVRLREVSGERRYTTLQMWEMEEAQRLRFVDIVLARHALTKRSH